MEITKDNYKKLRAQLEQLGFSQHESYLMLKAIEPPEKKSLTQLVSDFYDGTKEILYRMCKER